MHKYYMFVEGLEVKPKEFDTRRAAEAYMQEICYKNKVQISCIECDKHERVYTATNKERINFYINRV